MKNHQQIINNRLGNQLKTKSDFGAENGGKMAPKMRPGTAWKRQARDQKMKRRKVEKQGMQVTRATQKLLRI